MRQRVRDLLHARRGLIELRVQRCQLRVHGARSAQRSAGARQQLVGIARFGFIQALERATCCQRQAAAVGDAGAFLGQPGELLGAQLEGIEFLHLIAQQIEARMPVARSRFDGNAAVHQRQPRGVRGAHLADQRFKLAEAVEQFTLRGRAHQRLEFMLAMDVEQQLAHGAQHRQRNALAIEPGAAAAVIADHPAQDQFAFLGDRLLLEQVAQQAADARDIDGRRQLATLGAGAHHFGAGAAATEQLQRIDQHRLAGAGLAGEHRQPAAEVDFDRIDDGQIADLQMSQHASALLLLFAAPPAQFGAQQAEIIVTGRMQESDRIGGCRDLEAVAGLQVAEPGAVAGDFGQADTAIMGLDLDRGIAGNDDRPVGKSVRADGRHHQHVEARVDDRPAAGQRIGGGAGGGSDDHAIAAMRVEEPAVDAGLEIEHAPGLPAQQHHIIERQQLRLRAVGALQARLQQAAAIGRAAAIEHRIDAAGDILRQHISEETQPAAVDAEQRHVAAGQQPCRLEQGAVAAHGDDEIGARADLGAVRRQAGTRRARRRRPAR